MGYANGFSVDGYADPVATQVVKSDVSVSVDANVYRQTVQSSNAFISVDSNVYIVGTTIPAATMASDANIYVLPSTSPTATLSSDYNHVYRQLPAKLRRWNGTNWERVPTSYIWNGTSWDPVL